MASGWEEHGNVGRGRGIIGVEEGGLWGSLEGGSLEGSGKWSAMACLAEEKCGIERLFDTRELDPRGKYKVTLFDGTANKCRGGWVTIVL